MHFSQGLLNNKLQHNSMMQNGVVWTDRRKGMGGDSFLHTFVHHHAKCDQHTKDTGLTDHHKWTNLHFSSILYPSSNVSHQYRSDAILAALHQSAHNTVPAVFPRVDHTQLRTTVGRTPLDEWSARRRYLYLAKHNTTDRQTDINAPGGIRTHNLSRRAAAEPHLKTARLPRQAISITTRRNSIKFGVGTLASTIIQILMQNESHSIILEGILKKNCWRSWNG